jgi:hypothetical protein
MDCIGRIVLHKTKFGPGRTSTTVSHILAPADGAAPVTFRLRVYTATELARLLEDVGFAEIDCFASSTGQLARESCPV